MPFLRTAGAYYPDTVANTTPFNLTGHPAISVPCGEVEGLPVGLQFIGNRHEDSAVIEAAAQWGSIQHS